MKYRNKIVLPVLVAVMALSSCEKGYLDVNDDPNRSTDDNITPELLFTQAADGVGRRQASGNFSFINNWMGYLSTSGDFAIDQTETSYAIDFSFGDNVWQNHYGVLFDLYLVKQKALDKGDKVLAGASMVLSAKLWQELVDIFGNIPYSQAFQFSVTRTPAYDAAPAIYADLQKKLDSAIIYLKTASRSTFAGVDIVNHGNKVLWTKFANTLKLRLLIRQSQTAGFSPTAELTKIRAEGSILQSGETISVNPGYLNEAAKQSPFYANYGYTPTNADASTVTRANDYFVDLLAGTGDPRIDRFYAPLGSGAIVGTTYGLAAGNPIGSASSKFGPGLLGDEAGTAGAVGPKQNQWILTATESLFLDAEAKARGWDTGTPGTAEEKFDEAVLESFTWLGVEDPATAAADYKTDNPDIADYSTVAAASTTDKAKFITYQKYISLAGIDPLESWADLRRLNMIPDNGYISVNPSRRANSLPVRLLYPQSEYTTNAESVNAQGTINPYTSKIFWQP